MEGKVEVWSEDCDIGDGLGPLTLLSCLFECRSSAIPKRFAFEFRTVGLTWDALEGLVARKPVVWSLERQSAVQLNATRS